MTERRILSRKEKAEILLRQEGRCAECGERFTPDDPPDFDHRQARGLGGSEDLSNFGAIHRRKCHKPKTKSDVKAIAKGKRQRKKFGALRGLPAPEPKFKRKIASPGFDKRFTKKLYGMVVPREVIA